VDYFAWQTKKFIYEIVSRAGNKPAIEMNKEKVDKVPCRS